MTLTVQRPLVLVGCGKMGGAMLSGWLESGIAAAGVIAVEPMGAADFDGRPEVEIVAGPEALPETLDPEVVVFAVKPQQMDEVAGAYRRFAAPGTVFLSIAAGTTISYFTQQLGPGAAIVRAMRSARASPSVAAMRWPVPRKESFAAPSCRRSARPSSSTTKP